MYDDPLTKEAHALMDQRVLKQAAAISAIVDPIARLWCRSFGVQSDTARQRLNLTLSKSALEAVAAGIALDDITQYLDAASERTIRSWFVAVLDRPIAEGQTALAIIRLAFIEANRDGRWGDAFLDWKAPFAELASDINPAIIEPIPALTPRRMIRQVI